MSDRGEEKTTWKLPTKIDAYHLSPDASLLSADASLFSVSLPILHEKLNFSESDQNGRSLDNGLPSLSKLQLEDDMLHPHEYTNLNTTGSFFPGDKDKRVGDLEDDFDLSGLPTQLEDLDDDVFRSGGGLEIDNASKQSLASGMSGLSTTGSIKGSRISHYGSANGVGTVSGEHPYGEHPSRTLFVRNINSSVEESELRSLFEQYGDIRKMYTACKHRGFVMISYYDIRDSRTAMRALQNKPLRRRNLDIHFSIPKENPSEKDSNQGTLVVFNLDPHVSNDDLYRIFVAYGEIKEIRETPYKRYHRFVEYFDVRAAEAALKALNRSDIFGKRIKVEPSRPGGAHRSLMQQHSQEQEQDKVQTLRQVGSPIANTPPAILIDRSLPDYGNLVEQNPLHSYSQVFMSGRLTPAGSDLMSGLASIVPSHPSHPVKVAPFGEDHSQISQVIGTAEIEHGVPFQQYFSVPGSKLSSNHGSMSPFSSFKPSSAGMLSGPEFLWGSPTTHSEHVSSSELLPALKGHTLLPSGGVGLLNANPHSSLPGPHRPHIGSAPSGMQLDRNFGLFPELTESSYINQASLGAASFGHNNMDLAMNVGASGIMKHGASFTGNFTENGYPSFQMMPISSNGTTYFGNGSLGSMGDGIIGRGRGRRVVGGSQMDDSKQYQIDLGRIINGEDARTTLMIKSIPNKYTSKMLITAIDETHKGSYDFLYLPIDFKNKCNVGYAFINMVSPFEIITFYKAFNGKKWETFNSEKVATLAYARIQGKDALVSHFKNSSLMNEDKSYRPIVFQSEGQEHFPSTSLNIFIRRPDGSYVGDSLDSPKGGQSKLQAIWR